MILRIHHPDAEPYPIDEINTLEDAIEAEADNVLTMANSDHLEENTDECRDLLHRQVVEDATRSLRTAGDTYTDPIGTKWSLDVDPEA